MMAKAGTPAVPRDLLSALVSPATLCPNRQETPRLCSRFSDQKKQLEQHFPPGGRGTLGFLSSSFLVLWRWGSPPHPVIARHFGRPAGPGSWALLPLKALLHFKG